MKSANSLPQGIKSEYVVLNALIFNEWERQNIVENIIPEHFYDTANRIIINSILDDLSHNREILSEKYLSQIDIDKVDLRINTNTAIEYLQDRYNRDDLMKNSQNLLNQIRASAPMEIIQEAINRLISLKKDQSIQEYGISEIVEKLPERKEISSRIYWGYDVLERYHLRSGRLVIVGARPSIGKTSFACSLISWKLKSGLPCGMISLEMTRFEIIDRLVSHETGIAYKKVESKLFESKEESQVYTDCLSRSHKYPFRIATISNCNLLKIGSVIRSWVTRYDTRVVFIDYLQKITMPKAERHDLAIGFFTSALKDLALQLDIVIFLLVQVHRDSDNKQPRCRNLKDSGRIEEDADMVILLHKETTEEQELNNSCGISSNGMVKILIDKNRSGPTGMEELQFIKETMSFFGVQGENNAH